MTMLDIAGVAKTFTTRRGRTRQETHALAGVELSVREGEFLVIVGASGCGKSTLLRMIDGLTTPTAGEISIRGGRVTGPGPDRGVVFQHAHLLPWRTVRRNVDFGLECLRLPAAVRRERTAKYLDIVGLAGFAEHYPGQLSGGMQQRVGLARALAVEPEILLLDEPFGALDAQTRLVMQTELERIWSLERRTAVLITHDIEEALFLADRVAVMTSRPGRVAQIVEVPFDRPRTDALRSDAEFGRMKLELWEALRAGVEQP